MSIWEYSWVECPDRPHRPPEGPCEDISVCYKCGVPSYVMRPEGETYYVHDDDCCLPERHESYCQPGGTGHPIAPVIRGYWPGEFGEPTVAEAIAAQALAREGNSTGHEGD